MVEVNLTLLIQMVHFIIAYVLLRVFLWRPVMRYLQEEEQHKELLNDELKKQNNIVEQKEFDLTKIKSETQRAFANNIPSLGQLIVARRIAFKEFELKIPTISPDHLKSMVSVIVQKLEE